MNPWDALRKVAADRTSGAAELASRTARAIAALETERDLRRAARRILRSHGAMGSLWRVFAAAMEGPQALARIAERLEDETDHVARAAAGWALPRRANVLTHSSSAAVASALRRAKAGSVVCAASLPGGEGRVLAARLRREGIEARVAPDSTVVREAAHADVILVGADAVTPGAIVNKVGTYACALAAREHGVVLYALAGTTKMVPHETWNPDRAKAFEAVPIELFDAIVTERGPLKAAAASRAAAKIALPATLMGAVR